MSSISCIDLCKYYQQGDAVIKGLDHVSLEIDQGSFICLSGPSGSGKTTLFKIMSGLLRPDSIQVDYQGRQMNWKQAKPVLQRDIIYLHQQPYLFDASVADNVAYGLYRRGESKNSVQKKVFQALDWANLSHLAQRHAKHLSGGEKQRVALTRARISMKTPAHVLQTNGHLTVPPRQ